MPEARDPALQPAPFVCESLSARALHFSLGDLQSRMRLDDPHALDLEYTRLMMGFLLFHPAPEAIAMIGLGGGSLAKFCHRHLPRSRIRVVEINPQVIALRDQFQVPPDDERFTVLPGDGAQFVRDVDSRCDVLLVDGYDHSGLPARLCSQRFYDDCADLLQPGGIMVANLHHGHARFELCLDRIRRSFDDSLLAVDGADLGNSIVFACKGHGFERFRPRRVRAPSHLDPAAAKQLASAFALIQSALAAQRR